jgi:hypothetical protein
VRILLLFVDGVVLGPDDPSTNPFSTAHLPVLMGLLDGRRPVLENAPAHASSATLIGLDATLGVDGTPQSGTGQATLLTGRNAARLHGRHFGPWVPTALRAMVAEESVLARAKNAGRSVAFANAYPEEAVHRDDSKPDRRRPSFLRAGPPVAALGAGVLVRHTDALMSGDAVASEITNEAWRLHLRREGLPRIDARRAGVNLARITNDNDLTLFAHYSTDTIAHRGDFAGAVSALEVLDSFIGGVVSAVDHDCLVVIASDHGNIEDARTGHTRNPALCIATGRGHARFGDGVRTLADVCPAILEALGVLAAESESGKR